MKILQLAIAVGFIACAESATAETAYVKARGEVDLGPFQCQAFRHSANVQRICYDSGPRYLLVSVKGIWYHFCEVPAETVARWQKTRAALKGRYYNDNIRANFDCAATGFPQYR